VSAPYYVDSAATVYRGDCVDVMRALPACSIDTVVTDPPYGIGFMGEAWDAPRVTRRTERGRATSPMPPGLGGPHGGYRSASVEAGRYSRSLRDAWAFQEWCGEWASEALRVLKPGGFLLAFGGARTWHRLACAVEDAGFEVRDSIAWLYGSGFPKSVDVGAAVDASLGHRRQVATRKKEPPRDKASGWGFSGDRTTTVPASAEARAWEGWGTALKPGFEPCVVARKPLCGTVADNVLAHGVGAIHVDACRVPMSEGDAEAINAKHTGMDVAAYKRPPGASLNLSTRRMPLRAARAHQGGRWPTNVVLDEEAARALDAEYDDQGGPSRFFPVFRYESKAPASERPTVDGVSHPTVKPLELMRWLVRLTTPHGGTVLDPFAGSGTTLEAAIREGMRVIGVEREESYLPLIMSRLARDINIPLFT
jgi:site-specific DNA-methyltransferase (adenine-specific)